eukprot:164149_1
MPSDEKELFFVTMVVNDSKFPPEFDGVKEFWANLIEPSFKKLLEFEKQGTVLGTSLPLGSRTFKFFLKASSNKEADELVKSIPCWPVATVTMEAMTTLGDRYDQDKVIFGSMTNEKIG